MWVYSQSSGKLEQRIIVGTGYSGADPWKNNPDAQDVPKVGPIPEGTYAIGIPKDTPAHGPYVMALAPDPTNKMFGRSGFLIHGDSIKAPGTASEGCIILPRVVREKIGNSKDTELVVIA